MYRFTVIHSLLRKKYSGALQCLLNHHAFCTEFKPESNKRLYDVTTYQFQYSAKEENTILKVLNQSSEKDLIHFGITKSNAKRLLKGRENKGHFHNVSQLLDVDGFGLKSIENVCSKLLNVIYNVPDSSEKEQTSTVLFHKKRLVKPKVVPRIIESTETLLALELAVSSLSWTHLDRHGTVIDLGLIEVLSKTERLDAPKLYDKMVSVSRSLPVADIYVWEEKANYSYLQKAPLGSIIVAMKLAQMRGMLTALLDSREGEEREDRLFYLRDLLVSKLFQLKVGEERISGLNLADDLMNCERVLDWLPPLQLDYAIKDKYFATEKAHRKQISTSLFIGLAFQQTILENNLAAHKILVDKE